MLYRDRRSFLAYVLKAFNGAFLLQSKIFFTFVSLELY